MKRIHLFATVDIQMAIGIIATGVIGGAVPSIAFASRFSNCSVYRRVDGEMQRHCAVTSVERGKVDIEGGGVRRAHPKHCIAVGVGQIALTEGQILVGGVVQVYGQMQSHDAVAASNR